MAFQEGEVYRCPDSVKRPDPRAGLPAIWADGFGRASIRSVQALTVAAFAWAVLWALTRVPLVVIPATIAVILSAAIAPAVRWLASRGLPRALAVAVSFLAILAVFGGVVTGVVLLIRSQWTDLRMKAVAGIDQLHNFLNNGPFPVSDQQLNAARESVQRFFTSAAFGTEALNGVRTVGDILVATVLMAVTLFFLLKDGAMIRGFLIGFLPANHRAKAHLAADRSAVVLGGYVRGTALVAATNGLIVTVALLILGVPLALPLGVFVFIGGFIPIVGSTVAGTVAVAVALISNGPVTAVIVLAVIVAVNQLEHHFLQPVLMGKVLSIHGLAILLALAAGTLLAGVIGALLAVPITAVGWTIFKTLTGREPDPATTDPPPEPADT